MLWKRFVGPFLLPTERTRLKANAVQRRKRPRRPPTFPKQAVFMALPDQSESARGNAAAARAFDLALPLSFSAHIDRDGLAPYLLQSPFKELLAFFQDKGLTAI